MGERGPKPDPDQAAKGFPGRRRSKAQKAAEESARIAALLAPRDGATADLPMMLQDAKYVPAATVWRKLAPELRRTHRLPREAEDIFVMFCIYAQEWTTATEDLHTRGFTQSIKTVAGGKMERRRPQAQEREVARANVLELSGRFGLTPTDMHALFKGQAAVAANNPGLFGEDRRAEPDPEPEAPTAQPASRIGSLARMRSAPPGEQIN